MIQGIKDITSENPIKQIWKFLRFFLDDEAVADRIREIQNLPTDMNPRNIKKQATQIGYCIRQAEEYFQASSQVGLATRPTLLYYGAVSLSQALVLLKQSGDYSFDALRSKRKHKHHGLEIVGDGNIQLATVEDFLRSVQCKMYVNPQQNIPWGTFTLLYRSLFPDVCLIPRWIYRKQAESRWVDTTYLESKVPVNQSNLPPIESLISARFNLLDMTKTLPDIYYGLKELGIEPNLLRGSAKLQVVRYYETDESRFGHTPAKVQETFDFFLHDFAPHRKNELIALYKQEIPLVEVADLGPSIHLKVVREHLPPFEQKTVLPDVMDDINGRIFFLTEHQRFTSEPVTYLMILFCLGMLSRYYPDVWMKAIDRSVRIAEFTDLLLNVAYRKFPNLILDQMTLTKHHIHL